MNHEDRHHGSLPARQSDFASVPALEPDDAYQAHLDAGPTRRITFRLIARALQRHWWQAAVLWLIGSVGLMALAYAKVHPTYNAFSRISVEQGERGLFTQNSNQVDFSQFLETQVAAVTSPPVIQAALAADPELARMPRLAQAEDAEDEIRRSLSVVIVPKTNLIEVGMSSESAQDSTKLVNAVVNAYLKIAGKTLDHQTDQQLERLRDAKAEKYKEMEVKRNALTQLQQKMRSVNVAEVKDRALITAEDYRMLSGQLLTLEIDLIDAENRLFTLQNDQAAPIVVDDPQQMERELRDQFYNHPQVVEIKHKLDQAQERYNAAARLVRLKSDPSLTDPRKRLKDYQAQLDELWTQLRPGLAARIGGGRAVEAGDNGLKAAERQVSALNARKSKIMEKLETLTVRQRNEGEDAVALEFTRADLARATDLFMTIEKQLSEKEYEAKNRFARIQLLFSAQPSNRPNSNNRLRIMALAPIGMMFGVLGLLVLMELNAGRVVDPEDIPGRIRVPVIGVVPPLPQLRPATGMFSSKDEFRTQRQLDQFVQSLDHLRVALCSGRNAWGRERRCIIITSACSAEGKTTLAAQLSERCVNAGLSTLLIDGDLRNPTLSRMLDVPTNRGFINALRGEITLDDGLIVVGGAGGFHFLPAGTPKVDPSRLLHGERLQKLLTQAKSMFDIVIVDAPPVLPVPDALTIGRWCDGAVLAVRYDLSRFPLVEKANRRLAAVGVPVIGAVVNGVRVADSSYGSYYPSYAYSTDRAAETPLDV